MPYRWFSTNMGKVELQDSLRSVNTFNQQYNYIWARRLKLMQIPRKVYRKRTTPGKVLAGSNVDKVENELSKHSQCCIALRAIY